MLGKQHFLVLFLSQYLKWLLGLESLFFSKQIFQGWRNSVKSNEQNDEMNSWKKKKKDFIIDRTKCSVHTVYFGEGGVEAWLYWENMKQSSFPSLC